MSDGTKTDIFKIQRVTGVRSDANFKIRGGILKFFFLYSMGWSVEQCRLVQTPLLVAH